MAAQFTRATPQSSKCGATPNAVCQMPKRPCRIRPNRRNVISSYLGQLQLHKPKPVNRVSRIRPNRGLAEYLLGGLPHLHAMNFESAVSAIGLLGIGGLFGTYVRILLERRSSAL